MVSGRDRGGLRHHDRSRRRHRLQENRRGSRVAVVAHGEDDRPRAREPLTHKGERDVHLDHDVLLDGPEHAGRLAPEHEPERPFGASSREREEELEVPAWIGSDRHEVRFDDRVGLGREVPRR